MNTIIPHVIQSGHPDLTTALHDTRFVVVDLETTGSGPGAAITEFGAVQVCGGCVRGEFQTLVNPGTPIPSDIAALTGITDQMVSGAPDLREVLTDFLKFTQGTVLVAHNASFDIGFLKRGCKQVGIAWSGNPVIDTVMLARRTLTGDEVPDCKLSTLAAYFHATTDPNHRALSDARATVDVLYGLFERLGSLNVSTCAELFEFTYPVPAQRRRPQTTGPLE